MAVGVSTCSQSDRASRSGGESRKRRENSQHPRNIERRPNSFFLVPVSLQSGSFDFRCERLASFFLTFARFVLLIFFQALKARFCGENRSSGRRFVPQRGYTKKNNQCGNRRDENVDESSEPLPAGAFRVVKEQVLHVGVIDYRMRARQVVNSGDEAGRAPSVIIR